MKAWIRIAAAIFASTCASLSLADVVPAPLGLIWGAGPDHVKGLGVELQPVPGKDYGESYNAQKIPKALSDQETALLSFGFDNRLWRVVIISRPFEHDPQGTSVKSRYNQLLSSLGEKYGRPVSVHSLGDSLFARPDWFTYGLREGKSFWYSDFNAPEMTIQLAIRGEGDGSARWVLFYTNETLGQSFKEDKKLKEKGAL